MNAYFVLKNYTFNINNTPKVLVFKAFFFIFSKRNMQTTKRTLHRDLALKYVIN